tara:strand:- start:133 stop:888 length:756 start_codon:yes stop_codon:yes gene_type:complete
MFSRVALPAKNANIYQDCIPYHRFRIEQMSLAPFNFDIDTKQYHLASKPMPSSTSTSQPSSASSLPPAISDRVRNISSQLEGVRAHLKPLLQLPIQTTLTTMPPIERARLQVAVGFAVNALMFIYLKTKGENPSEHPVKKELDRVRAYLKKMKSAEASIKEAARKNDVRERHGLPTNASIAFVDTSVARRTVERTLGIKRKQKCSDAQAQVEKSDRESSSSSSSNASSAKKAKRTSKTIKPKVSQKKKKKR